MIVVDDHVKRLVEILELNLSDSRELLFGTVTLERLILSILPHPKRGGSSIRLVTRTAAIQVFLILIQKWIARGKGDFKDP
jgi:hypothetical protein